MDEYLFTNKELFKDFERKKNDYIFIYETEELYWFDNYTVIDRLLNLQQRRIDNEDLHNIIIRLINNTHIIIYLSEKQNDYCTLKEFIKIRKLYFKYKKYIELQIQACDKILREIEMEILDRQYKKQQYNLSSYRSKFLSDVPDFNLPNLFSQASNEVSVIT